MIRLKFWCNVCDGWGMDEHKEGQCSVPDATLYLAEVGERIFYKKNKMRSNVITVRKECTTIPSYKLTSVYK